MFNLFTKMASTLQQCSQLMSLSHPLLPTADAPALTALLHEAETLASACKAALLQAAENSPTALVGLPTDALQDVLWFLSALDLASVECCSKQMQSAVHLCVQIRSAAAHGTHGTLFAQLQPRLKVSPTYRLHWLDTAHRRGTTEFATAALTARRKVLRPPIIAGDDPCSFAIAVFRHSALASSEVVGPVSNTSSAPSLTPIETVCDVITEASKLRNVPTAGECHVAFQPMPLAFQLAPPACLSPFSGSCCLHASCVAAVAAAS